MGSILLIFILHKYCGTVVVHSVQRSLIFRRNQASKSLHGISSKGRFWRVSQRYKCLMVYLGIWKHHSVVIVVKDFRICEARCHLIRQQGLFMIKIVHVLHVVLFFKVLF